MKRKNAGETPPATDCGGMPQPLLWGFALGAVAFHGRGFRLFASHAQFQLLVAVHAEHAEGGATDLRLADDVNSFPAEVVGPSLLAGVKERGYRVCQWIDTGEIGAFVEIAVNAGETKV